MTPDRAGDRCGIREEQRGAGRACPEGGLVPRSAFPSAAHGDSLGKAGEHRLRGQAIWVPAASTFLTSMGSAAKMQAIIIGPSRWGCHEEEVGSWVCPEHVCRMGDVRCLTDASLLLFLAAGSLGAGHGIPPQGHAQISEERSREELGPSCLPILAT